MNGDPANSSTANILIVDNVPTSLDLLVRYLQAKGYIIQIALTGKTGLSMAAKTQPDLILLEVELPDLDGYAVCQQLKGWEFTRHIPAIFTSYLDTVDARVKAFSAGAADYIVKPPNLEEALARIKNQLQMRILQKELQQKTQRLQQQNVRLQQEIRDRTTTETALAASEAKHRALIDAIPDVMFRIHADGTFLDSRGAEEISAASNNELPTADPETQDTMVDQQTFPVASNGFLDRCAIGKKVSEVLSDDLALWTMHYVAQALSTHEMQIGEYMHQINGCWRGYEVRYVASGPEEVLAIVRDISARKQSEAARRQSAALLREQTQRLQTTLGELKQAQAQLVQNEKMVALGQLIAGVAHELNNPVSFIYGNLGHARQYTQGLLHLIELYRTEYPHPAASIQAACQDVELDFLVDDLPKLLNSIELGSERIRNIVIGLRNFSRLGEAPLKMVNIHEGIDSTLSLLQHRLRSDGTRSPISIIKEYGQLPKVTCNASQLNQVFMNLLTNAIDALEGLSGSALPQSPGVDPSTNLLPHPPAQSTSPTIWIRTEQRQNNQVAIQIADNGPGIAEALRSHLFEPFFTTKPVGSGTGLGLSISYQIVVEKHKGQLYCQSSPGQGATFTIEIPINRSKS